MTDSTVIEQKVIAAFKGFINSYKLEPMAPNPKRLEPDYRFSWRTFTKENEDLELFYKIKTHGRILELVSRLFPGQVDSKLTSRYLLDTVTKWIEAGNDPNDQTQLEVAGQEFIATVKTRIKPRLLYIPIEGLKVNINRAECISLGNCTLFSNGQDSELYQLLEQQKKRFQDEEDVVDSELVKRVTAYFTCKITGHPERAIQRGIEEANLALSVLRLYIASSYFHEHRKGIVRRMGLAGTLHLDEQLGVFYIDPNVPIVDQYPGSHEEMTVHRELEIKDEFVEYMKENGLSRINQLLQSLDSSRSGDDLARRLLRAITWFAKGTYARSIADSFLMYAIAVEGLLSEDRTPQETYAIQMAALVTYKDGDGIYPVGGYISTQFATELKKARNLNDRYNIIRDRILNLFNYRNRIAHGAVLEDEIDTDNLLDFETLVKNAILSFVKSGWDSLGKFKEWAHKSVRYDFVPYQDNL